MTTTIQFSEPPPATDDVPEAQRVLILAMDEYATPAEREAGHRAAEGLIRPYLASDLGPFGENVELTEHGGQLHIPLRALLGDW